MENEFITHSLALRMKALGYKSENYLAFWNGRFLDFFTWDYDEEADPIDELMKKYALKAIWVATANNYNLVGVQSWFKSEEGFIAVDGSQGVELCAISAYEFNEDSLDMDIDF